MKVFEEQQALAEKKFQLQQQEELLRIKSDLAQTAAREQVYADADDLEHRSEVEVKPEGTLLQVRNFCRERRNPLLKHVTLWLLGGLLRVNLSLLIQQPPKPRMLRQFKE